MTPVMNLLLYIVGVWGWTVNANSCSQTNTDQDILDAIRKTEAGGDVCALGDGGTSLGPYQIGLSYYNDAVGFDPSLRSRFSGEFDTTFAYRMFCTLPGRRIYNLWRHALAANTEVCRLVEGLLHS